MSSDRLSELPADIISHILSLMPTKYAVRTSVLSKRWRYSWMYVNNLDFDNDIRTFPVLTKLVDGALTQCKSSQIKLFRLHFIKLRIKSSSVLSWINEAVKLNVNELDIKVIGLWFSLSMLTCKTLTTLRLSCFKSIDCEFPCHVNLPCLKTLDVAVCTDPYAYVFKLIGGCPMLEILSLEEGWGITAGDYIFNIPTLKRLKLIRTSSIYCNKVVLNVPNLEHLFVGGLLYSNFVMEDVSSLVEASISFGEIKFYHVWVELLKGLIGVKSLSVQILNSGIDYKTFFSSSLPLFPKVKHLELKGYWQSRQIPQFLESFPELKHLCIEIVVDPFFEKPKEYSWVEPKLVPACMLMKLTTIKFSVCEWWKSDLPFLKYMLGNAEVLKTVAFTWEKLCLEEEQTEFEELLKFPRAREKLCLEEEQTQLCEELLKFPKASRCCEIQFHGNLSNSTIMQ